jgi:hypothetical protein
MFSVSSVGILSKRISLTPMNAILLKYGNWNRSGRVSRRDVQRLWELRQLLFAVYKYIFVSDLLRYLGSEYQSLRPLPVLATYRGDCRRPIESAVHSYRVEGSG